MMEWADSTKCIHGGSSANSDSGSGVDSSSGRKAIWQASVYEFESLERYTSTSNSSHIYRRYGFPNSGHLASLLASLESAQAGFATSSGMGAIIAAVLTICKSGDLAIVSRDSYGATLEFFKEDLTRFGVDVLLEDIHDPKHLESILKEYLDLQENVEARRSSSSEINSKGKAERHVVVFLESISNPILKIADTFAIANVCKKFGAYLIVDNTMATPLRTKPLLEGADLVVHSATKYLGGHDDLVAGVVVGASHYIEQSTKLATRWGLIAAPFDTWLAIRGIQTLEVRMNRAWRSSAILADRIAESQLVVLVKSAPKCAIICIEVAGGFQGANKAIESFKLVRLAPSFGGTSTTVSHSASSSHKMLSPEERMQLGITDGILRISVGLEDVEDIWSDLRVGLLMASVYAKHILNEEDQEERV